MGSTFHKWCTTEWRNLFRCLGNIFSWKSGLTASWARKKDQQLKRADFCIPKSLTEMLKFTYIGKLPLQLCTRMHSSRMRTARSLTVSHRIPCMPPGRNHACPPGGTTHAPSSNHAFPPEQPRMPPGATMHTPWQQPCMPPLAATMHAPPGATTHAPLWTDRHL